MLHRNHLLNALELAKTRRGFCAPNPSVGALVVRNNEVIATGFHVAAGHPHAEVAAGETLNTISDIDILYVTLEPCCHFGRTPPCTDYIIQRGFKRVVYGYQDSNPQVLGRGQAKLRQAGIECEYVSLPEISDFYQSYHFWQQTKYPFVTSKLAMSMDNKIAGPKGEPLKITGQAAAIYTHEQRLKSDAILTTSRTIIQDNPALNVRLTKASIKKPLYILDSQLKMPLSAQVFDTTEKITVFHSLVDHHKMHELEKKNVTLHLVSMQAGLLDLKEVMTKIGADGIHDLWVEAGGKVFEALIEAELVHKSLLYIAPKLLGELCYPALNQGKDIFKKAKAIKWRSVGVDAVCEIDWS